MRGNSLSFFKPPVFVKTILLSCAFFASMFFNSCKQLTSFDPNVDGVRVAVSNAFSAPTDLKATHGRKQMISLEWTPVSGAKYYDVYCAESATAEFKKIGGTDKNSFDDKVGAGRTLYYRVCATKSDGTQSELSATVKGTSLAQPVISGGDVEADSATISWFMENARAVDGTDNYESSLMFVVHWQQKNGGTPNEEILSAKEDFENSFYEHKIKNLSGAADYEFWIDAYLSGDQSSVESSPRVDKKTLTSYTPLAPVFTASQGESAKGIWLYITLPEKVMVQTETKLSPNEKVDEPYPLYFKIYRKIGEMGEGDSDADWGSPVCERLYCNGTTTPPTEADYAEAYNAGAEIKWLDESANLVGGEKYTYRIISVVDTNYSKVVCPDDKQYNGNASTPPNKATTALGWKSAHPDFKVNYSADSRTLSPDNTEVVSVSFGFDAGWKDLGKAGGYKFAIKQNKKPWTVDYTGNGDDTWLNNASGEPFFGTIDEINSCAVKFGSESGLKTEEGVYSYTLYVVLKDAAIGDVTDGGEKVLDSVKATDEIVVTDVVELPKAELEVQGGYKDNVKLTIAFEEGVTYKVVRTRLDTIPQDVKEFEITVPENHGASFEYPDTVEGNGRYSYMLKAIATNGAFSLSPSQEAETLGTPKVSFEKGSLSYDSVTISFDGVLAAERYAVQLGTSGGFGGGATFDITKSGDTWVGSPSSTATANVKFEANKFTVTINKPEGYDDATKAGTPAKLTVTAHSNVNDAPSEAVDVNVLGPACLEAKVNTADDATEDSISLTWKKVDGAKGYLIRRVMYKTADSNEVYDDSEVTYYCDASGENDKFDLADGGRIYGRATISLNGEIFTLTDKYMEKDTDDVDLVIYQEAQAKIPWGLPFRYVVLPVLDKKDFDFASKSLALAEGGKVAYENIKKIETKKAATFGYGLNLVADKATSGTMQHIEWEKPYNAQQPVVYRRAAGSNDAFTKFEGDTTVANDKNAGDLTIESKDCYDAFEYVVKYYSTKEAYPKSKIDIDEFPPSLLAEIKKGTQTYDTPQGAMTELNNKGYLLTMDGFDAKVHSTNYYEQIRWNQWQYDKRAVGPDSMVILVQNNNIDADFHELVSIEKANVSTDASIKTIADDIKAEKDQNTTIRIAPAGIAAGTSGTTDGYLKVLRDYRHNYTFRLERTVGETPISVSYKEYEKDAIKTAYRQITDEELVRAATLAMTFGMRKSFEKRGGSTWGAAASNQNAYNQDAPGGGSAHMSSGGATKSVYHNLIYSNFYPVLETKSGENVIFLKLNGTVKGDTENGYATCPPKQYDGTLTVSLADEKADEKLKNLYAKTITFSKLYKELDNNSGSIAVEGRTKISKNITPLPFGHSTASLITVGIGNYTDIDFQDTSEEWQ